MQLVMARGILTFVLFSVFLPACQDGPEQKAREPEPSTTSQIQSRVDTTLSIKDRVPSDMLEMTVREVDQMDQDDNQRLQQNLTNQEALSIGAFTVMLERRGDTSFWDMSFADYLDSLESRRNLAR